MEIKIVMMKKIFKSTLILFSVLFSLFVFTNQTYAAVHNFTATISPATAIVNENLTYSYTVTNGSDSTAKIGSVEIQLPSSFGTPTLNISSASPDRTWELATSGSYLNGFDASLNKIGIKADSGASKLDNDEFVTVQITTTAPSTANSYEWTANPLANLGLSGTAFTITGTQPVVVVTEETESEPDPTPDPTPDPDPILTETFIIRNGDTVLFNGSVNLPDAGNVEILDINNVTHTVNARSVLAVLKNIDDANDSFIISNLQYFDSFSSFYLKCITPIDESQLCDNWQYAVGSFTPFSSIDSTILAGGETVGIYFGTSRQVVLSSNAITTSESLTATSEKYDYANNTWGPLTGVNIGVTLPNPDDVWSPIVVSTHAVDFLGVANITITDANVYTLGIVEDFYFPSYTVTVTEPIVPPTGGGGGSAPTPVFSVPNAVSYLESKQEIDGSFGNSMLYTDWATMALSSNTINSSVKDKILNYMKANNTISSLITDNERHAMALLALNQNPYDFNGVNYIKSIIDSFDGTQFGDVNLINDDIFALIPLANAGYQDSDNEINKTIAFIISKQKSNGSWEESVDMTSASVQALKQFENVSRVGDAINKASIYLQNQQGVDGGWGNVSSTSWVMQAQSSIGVSWNKNGKTCLDYLALQQTNANNNGSVLVSTDTLQNNIWATSYAIPAGLSKTWANIMNKFAKPVVQEISGSCSNCNGEEIKKVESEKLKVESIEQIEIKTEIIEDPVVTDDIKEELIETVVDPVRADGNDSLPASNVTGLVQNEKLKVENNLAENSINKDLLTASAGQSRIKWNWRKINVPQLNQLPFVRQLRAIFSVFPKLFHLSLRK